MIIGVTNIEHRYLALSFVLYRLENSVCGYKDKGTETGLALEAAASKPLVWGAGSTSEVGALEK